MDAAATEAAEPDETAEPQAEARKPSWWRRVWRSLGFGERRWTKGENEEVQPAKTFWDFLQLLLVPLLLFLIAWLFNGWQASRDRSRGENSRQDATLDAYFKEMGDLILDRELQSAPPHAAVHELARTLTLTTVRRLDAERKGDVIWFLAEAGLLNRPKNTQQAKNGPDTPPVDVGGADFRGADLRGGRLVGTVLDDTDLGGARFDGTELRDASFFGADLHGASFDHSTLNHVLFQDADLSAAALSHTSIQDSSFEDSCLTKASFAGAQFDYEPKKQTTFEGAQGRDIDFSNTLGLTAIRADGVSFVHVRLDGTQPDDRPTGWGPSGPREIQDRGPLCIRQGRTDKNR
jgi:uncharacterized protein YjbI with pentapeptide repeats